MRHVGIKAKNGVPTSQRLEIIFGHIEVYVVIGTLMRHAHVLAAEQILKK
jgi:hypothetical protein